MKPRFTGDLSPTTGQQAGASLRETDLGLLDHGQPSAYGYQVRQTLAEYARTTTNLVALRAKQGPALRIQTP